MRAMGGARGEASFSMLALWPAKWNVFNNEIVQKRDGRT